MRESDLTFGIEFECYLPMVAGETNSGSAYARAARALQAAGLRATSGRARGAWSVVHDGSLGERPTSGGLWTGVEFVSPILQGEAGIAEVLKVCEVLTALRCEVNKSCGLHVHVGVGSANAKQMRNLAKLFLKYEEVLSSLTPPSRRAGIQVDRYCRPNLPVASGATRGDRALMLAAAFARIDRATTPRKVGEVVNGAIPRAGEHYASCRYYRMNMSAALIYHGTVEFRQAAGTTNGDKAVSWVRLILALVAQAFSAPAITLDGAADLNALLRKVDRKTAAYLTARHAALNPAPAPAARDNEIPF